LDASGLLAKNENLQDWLPDSGVNSYRREQMTKKKKQALQKVDIGERTRSNVCMFTPRMDDKNKKNPQKAWMVGPICVYNITRACM
jgi:hypothetical protein